MTIFVQDLKNHLSGEFVKFREFILVIIFVIFTQNDHFGFKNENCARNSAKHFILGMDGHPNRSNIKII